MKNLTSIVAINRQGAIGFNNELPWRLPTDLDFFKRETSGGVVIMGRKTYDSIGRPLPGRFNIVISHNQVLFQKTENSCPVSSLAEALYVAEKQCSGGKKKAFVVGGASIYEQFAPLVDRYLITIVEKAVPHADAFFRESIIGDLEQWNVRELTDVRRDPAIDDSDFSIVLAEHKRSEVISQRRDQQVAEYQARLKPRHPARTRANGSENFRIAPAGFL